MVSIDYLSYGFKRLLRKPILEIIHFGYYNSKLIPIHAYNKLMLKKKGDLSIRDHEFVTNVLSLPGNSNIYESVYQHTLLKDKSCFFFNPYNSQLKKEYLSNYAKQAEETIKHANKYLNHEFDFLGRKIKFDNKVDYHYGFEQTSSQNIYFSDINCFIPDWDIKVTWELNRQQYLPILGKAYFITDNEKYAKEICDQIEQWIEQNPYLQGVNWVEGIEAAVRIYSWIFAYHFISNSKSLTSQANLKILKYIYLHGKFIMTFLSDKWIINGNHLLAELSALLLIGVTFPEFKDSKKWVSFALQKLESELNTQVLDDGVIWEHSTGYQKFVTEMILYPVILLRKNGYKIPEKILLKLEKMLYFLDSIAMSNGKIPLIGDEDQGFMLKLNFLEYDDVKGILSCGEALFEKKYRTNSELSFWLFGGLIFSSNKASTEKQNFELFKDSGYCLFRSSDDYLLLVTNAQNKKYLHAAHRHLDILSFVYECQGEYFIVDNGTYIYNSDKLNRNLFRSTWMHNTLTIDKKNPCELGPFEFQPKPYGKIIKFGEIEGNPFIWVSSDAYKPLECNRIILKTESGNSIFDFIECNDATFYESFIHLHPDITTEVIDCYKIKLIKNKKIIYLSSSKPITIIESKISLKYGVIANSKTLKIETNSQNYKHMMKISKNLRNVGEFEEDIISQILLHA